MEGRDVRFSFLILFFSSQTMYRVVGDVFRCLFSENESVLGLGPDVWLVRAFGL